MSTRTKGEIVDLKVVKKRKIASPFISSNNDNNIPNLYYPIISFMTNDRKKVKFTSQYYSKNKDRYAKGKEVIVEYDYQNPLDVKHIENNPEAMDYRLKFALGAAVVIAIIVLLAVFV